MGPKTRRRRRTRLRLFCISPISLPPSSSPHILRDSAIITTRSTRSHGSAAAATPHLTRTFKLKPLAPSLPRVPTRAHNATDVAVHLAHALSAAIALFRGRQRFVATSSQTCQASTGALSPRIYSRPQTQGLGLRGRCREDVAQSHARIFLPHPHQ